MKLENKILLKDGTEILFGIPDSSAELEEMFRLRYLVYVEEKEYIPKTQIKGNIEKDQHDIARECVYFIAKVDNEIIGSTRIIRSIPLPTEKDYYKFETPEMIASIPVSQRVEIGRIISRPSKLVNRSIPRHLIMLGLFYSMARYGKKKRLLGGYGSIKSSALNKLTKMGVPFYKIKKYSVIYNPNLSSDPLKNFFSDSDPVKLIYFITDRVYQYLDSIFSHKKLFNKLGKNVFLYQDNKLNIIDKILLKISFIFN
jgi:N-acyl-L-homoserine lactone synthetase